ncbi:MAG TPA: rhodanese-like domain-containing protein [Thermoanaerobaculia bacterium]|nr:rhodanese-like domain-containing protein [Thermoanaerobaculia bacterium]
MRFLRRALAFFAAALVCATVSNAFAGPERKLRWIGASAEKGPAPVVSGPIPASSSAVAVAKAEFPPHPDKPWVEISGEDAAALQARGDVPVLDARRTSVYREGHIAGARPFSVWEADVDDKVKVFFSEGHDPNAPILVYCSGGDCEDSHMVGQKLFFAGFNNVLVYKDGFPDWVKRGLNVTKGEKP